MEEKDIFKENLLKKPRKKIWLIISFIGILGIISCGYIIFIDNPFEKEIIPINDLSPIENVSFDQFICSQIRVTPSWVSTLIKNPTLIGEGFDNFNNSNSKDTVNLLINAQVYFVYQSNCGACKNQIGYFGTEWEKYVKSGYTINCVDI